MGIWEEEPLSSLLARLRLLSLATLRVGAREVKRSRGAGVGCTSSKRALDSVGLRVVLMVKHEGVRDMRTACWPLSVWLPPK